MTSCVELAEFLVDSSNSRSWRGMSRDDGAVLRLHAEGDVLPVGEWFTWVPVGSTPWDALGDAPPAYLHGVAECYRKRVDLVIHSKGVWWILEVKPSAGYVAMGQAQAYGALFRKMYPTLRPVCVGVVTDCLDPDLRDLYARLDVVVFGIEGRAFVVRGRPG